MKDLLNLLGYIGMPEHPINLNVGLTTNSASATDGPGLAHSSTLHEAIKPLRRKSRRQASGNQGWHRGTEEKSLFFT